MSLENILLVVEYGSGDELRSVLIGNPSSEKYSENMNKVISLLEEDSEITSYHLYRIDDTTKANKYLASFTEPTEHGCSQIWPKEYVWADTEVMSKWVY